MSRVYFKHCIVPCVNSQAARWHLAHGWIWDVWEMERQRFIGVFYATLLCGDGAVIHFELRENIQLHSATILSAFRRGIALVAANAGVVYATVPAANCKLIRCLCRLGFAVCPNAGFDRDSEKIELLKYFRIPSCKLNTEPPTKGD